MVSVCSAATPRALGETEAPRVFQNVAGVLNIAHRGASKHAPEHSVRAYELALSQGAQVLELDLRSTRDEELVVFHDSTLERTLGLKGKLRELSWLELSALAGARAPLRLQGVLQRFPGVYLNLELKDEELEPARVLARLLRQRGAEDHVLVASAHHEALMAFREASAGRVATSASVREVFQFYACYKLGRTCAAPYVALQLPRMSWLGLDEPAFIRHAQAQGLSVHFWTIDRPESMQALITAGADGIMTNHPDRLARLLQARRR